MLHSGKDMALRAELRRDWFKLFQDHRKHCLACQPKLKPCDFRGIVNDMLKVLRDDPR